MTAEQREKKKVFISRELLFYFLAFFIYLEIFIKREREEKKLAKDIIGKVIRIANFNFVE